MYRTIFIKFNFADDSSRQDLVDLRAGIETSEHSHWTSYSYQISAGTVPGMDSTVYSTRYCTSPRES